MSCACKNKIELRAKKLIYGRTWDDLNDIEQGQLGGLYQTKFGERGTDKQIREWLEL